MAVSPSPCLVISCRISHFGANPVSGGSPPSDKRTRGVRAVRAGLLVEEVASALILVALLYLKVRKVEVVMIR